MTNWVNELDSRTVGRLTVLSPVFGVAFAFLLNGERPSGMQAMALVLTTVGVLIASLGGKKTPKSKREILMLEPDQAASAP